MKSKFIFGFGMLMFLMGVEMEAQVVVTASDFADPGSEFYYNVDTTSTSLTPGSSGSGQSWTFTGLNVDRKDTTKFLDPANTPFGNDFPSATHAFSMRMGTNDTLYVYLENNAGGIFRMGVAGTLFGTFVKANYAPDPLLEIQYPAQVGVTFSDSGAVDLVLPASAIGNPPGIDSVKTSMRTKNMGDIDGDGTLTVNGVTYNNVLRGKFTSFEEIRYYAKGALTGGNWQDASSFGYPPQYDTTISYMWLSPAYGFSVFEINFDDFNETRLREIRYLDTAVVSIDPILARDLEFRLFVVSGKEREYRLHYNGRYELTSLSVTDLIGREYEVSVHSVGEGEAEFRLPKSMASGAYVLKAIFDGRYPFVRIIVVE